MDLLIRVYDGTRYLVLFGTKYSRMDQVKFLKGCLPQVLLGPFLDTLSHLVLKNMIQFTIGLDIF